MSKLPVLSGRGRCKALGKLGFAFDLQKGSHIILYRVEPPSSVTIPDHKELDRGTLRAILRQIDLTPAELIKLI